eukprot:TRINITY_DN21636_c3_g1_i2.p1 TRINITY_DN21636_c3_g1~~TRINITY_DN21636_c3_g1_i2.p1  ORF type:complete len:631 (+),score=105.75 TRINITY_DN21636_c3_g1_i2:93-1985(+)
MVTVLQLSQELQKGHIRPSDLLRKVFEKIEASPPCSRASFILLLKEKALAQARQLDQEFLSENRNRRLRPLAGIPVAVKDLLDISGEPTWAGGPQTPGQRRAERDSAVVERLKAAGAVIVGKTHLTENASVGHGHNPHYSITPLSPFGRAECGLDGRLPGGSSSGSGVCVADGIVPVAIGTDTGGSIRIPAAWCGICGFKPSFGRVPTEGCYPLGAASLDSIGPLANNIADCGLVFRVLAGLPVLPPGQISRRTVELSKMKFLVPGWCLQNLDSAVDISFTAALEVLKAAGAELQYVHLAEIFEELGALMKTTFTSEMAASNFDLLHDLERMRIMDPIVRERLLEGADVKASEYLRAQKRREVLCREFDEITKAFDAVLMPSVAVLPPKLSEAVSSIDSLREAAGACNRFTRLANILGRCAASLPCHTSTAPVMPVGLMVMGEAGGDERCLEVSGAIEAALRSAGLGRPASAFALATAPAAMPLSRRGNDGGCFQPQLRQIPQLQKQPPQSPVKRPGPEPGVARPLEALYPAGGWTVRVRVLHKGPCESLTTRQGAVVTMKLVVQDAGSEASLPATLWGEAAERYRSLIQEEGVYRLSNVTLRPRRSSGKGPPNELFLGAQSSLEPDVEK